MAAFWSLRSETSLSRSKLKQKLTPLGDITVLGGSAESRFLQAPEFVPLKDEPLIATETIQTDDLGRVEIALENGALLQLGENSRALFEGDSQHVQVRVLKGQVEVKKPGPAHSLELIQTTAPAAVVKPEKFAQTLVIPTKPTNENDSDASLNPDATPGAAADLQTLSQEEILRSLQGQNALFRRCYVGLLQRQKIQNAKTEVLVSFFIQATGKLTDARIWHSSVQDVIFLKCVSEVFERTLFRNFQGDTVRVDEFPLSFN